MAAPVTGAVRHGRVRAEAADMVLFLIHWLVVALGLAAARRTWCQA